MYEQKNVHHIRERLCALMSKVMST